MVTVGNLNYVAGFWFLICRILRNWVLVTLRLTLTCYLVSYLQCWIVVSRVEYRLLYLKNCQRYPHLPCICHIFINYCWRKLYGNGRIMHFWLLMSTIRNSPNSWRLSCFRYCINLNSVSTWSISHSSSTAHRHPWIFTWIASAEKIWAQNLSKNVYTIVKPFFF